MRRALPLLVFFLASVTHAQDLTALSFSGTNQYVAMGAATSALGASTFTIECWFLRTGTGVAVSTGTGGVMAIPLVSKGRSENDGSNVDCNYFLGIEAATNTLAADFEAAPGAGIGAGQNYPVRGKTVLLMNVWYHAAATYDGATWKLYLNGLEDGTSAPANAPQPRADSIQHFGIATTLNSTGVPSGYFKGIIDEVRVWNVARTGAQIAAGRNGQVTSPVSGLLARYGFGEAAGTLAGGLVPGAPDGSLINAPAWVTTTPFGANLPPTVALTAPANNSTYNINTPINLVAAATDPNGSIVRVEFFQGSTLLGEDTDAPYGFAWTGAPIGVHSLTAVARDDEGAATTSAAVLVTVTTPTSGTLTRGPYLNQANESSIVIRWRSSQPIVGRVRYGTSATSLNLSVDEVAATTEHVVPLAGLLPSTRYFYSVGSEVDTLAGGDAEHTFRTSPIPGTATDTRIWVLGDCGRANANQAAVRNAYYAWTGSRTPDLCLMLGDNAYNSGTDSEYQAAVFNMYSTFLRKMPLWSCLGNHDANNGSTDPLANFPYFDMFTFPRNGECGGVNSGTERYFSFDYGNVHFINLDSQTSNRATDGAMATWLRADLASTTKTWIIAFFHHPPYTKGSHDSDTSSQLIQMRENFGPILEAGGVDLVLTGHSHSYERSFFIDGHYGDSTTFTEALKQQPGDGRPAGDGAYLKPLTGPRDHFGAVYTLTGSAGSADGGPLNHPAMYVSYNTLGSFNLDINGTRLDATYIESDSEITDTFTIIKQGAADSDGDRIPDEYEILHGLNRQSAADAALDSDGDGYTNLEEWALGLLASTPDRYAWTVTRTNPNVTVTCPTLAGRTYRVWFSSDLVAWQPASAPFAGTGGDFVWIDDGSNTGGLPSGAGERFYRVNVTLPQ